MKKILFLSVFLLIFSACQTETNLIDFFSNGNKSYSGGFENAGYKIETKIIKKDNKTFMVENIVDTATIVQKIFIIDKNKVVLLSSKEIPSPSFDIGKISNFNGEIILKTPLKVGTSWVSSNNKYEITEVLKEDTGTEVTVEKTFSNGNKELTTYQNGFGIISKSFLNK